jgi:tetratricopeptide (TPR) repeat protein
VVKRYIELLLTKNQLEQAQKLDDGLLKATPDDADALIYKSQIEIAGGKASAAVNTLQALLKNEPDNAFAQYQLGLAFDQLGNGAQAETAWRNAVRLRPDLTEAHRALAGAAIQRGDAAALAVEGDQIIAQQPDSPDGYLLRAVAEIDRKQYSTAEDDINRSLQKAPNNPAAYVQLGNLRVAQNKPADAQKAFQQALDKDSTSIEALAGVLNGYVVQKQLDKALAVGNAQLAKSPQNAGFHILVGRLLLEQKKDAAGAEVEFRRAVELSKNGPEALLRLGMAQSAQGKTDLALQTYLDATKTYPKGVDFYFRAGNAYEDKQDWEKAKQMYQKVLELQADNALASNNLAFIILQQGGNVDVALAMAQTARRLLPDDPSCADTLGWAYYHKGVYNSAIDLFKEAVKKEPDSATYNLHLGLAYARNGQAALAKQQLQKIKPDSSEANELRQALAQSKG